jgi:hypothetical protein
VPGSRYVGAVRETGLDRGWRVTGVIREVTLILNAASVIRVTTLRAELLCRGELSGFGWWGTGIL